MGLDVSTYVVFGIVLDKSYVKSTKRSRGCKHAIKAGSKFCSECGKPTWIEESFYLLDSMEYDKLSYFYADYNSDEIILGFLLNKSGSHRSSLPSFLEVNDAPKDMISELKDFCNMHKIPYGDNDFKNYAFSYFSY